MDGRRAQVLLTGATGFVGKVVLAELMRRRAELGIERVHVLVRPRGRRSPMERFERVADSRCFSRLESGWREHCVPMAGDMIEPGLGLHDGDASRLRREVTHVIHCAASVKFDLPLPEAASVNITGALEVLRFTQGCSRVQRLVDVSTAYVTPHRGADVPVEEKLVDLPIDAEAVYASILDGTADQQALLATTGHPNTYTFTKCLAEILLAQRRGDLPLSLLRPSVVSACRRFPFPGWIDSHAAYAAFVSLLGAGHLRVVRIDPATIADIVPCDDVAHRIISCAFEPELQQPLVIRHAVAGLANSGQLSRLAFTHERHFQVMPHEREARWAYVGRSVPVFRLQELMHHQLPLSAVKTAKKFRGQLRAAVKVRRLANLLASLDESFHYFGHNTFDFRSSFPPLEDFDLDTYLQSVSEGISEHLLKRDPTQAPLRMHGGDLRWAMRQPEGNGVTRAFAYVVRKALRKGGADITYNDLEIRAAQREIGEDDLVILAPSHRSYLDFLVTSLVCFANPGLGLKLPSKAAADDFARIPIIGRLLHAAGAFYIKRGLGAPDPQLTQQIADLVDAGKSLEFYPEGARSRCRRYLAPKRGILRALQASGRTAVVLPLCISYDRISEEEGFLRELQQGVRHGGGLGPLLQWARKLARGQVRLGRIHIRCGAPLRLDADTDVKAMSNRIIAELQRHTSVSTFHLRAFCNAHPGLGIDPLSLRRAIELRGGDVIESTLDASGEMSDLLQRTFVGQWMHLFYGDALERAPGNVAVAAHVARNGFWYPAAPDDDDAGVDAILTALFTPICSDYQRVTRRIEALKTGERVTAHELVTALPGVLLADAEDALADLAERAILVRDGSAYRWADGPRELGWYRSACAWPEMVPAPLLVGQRVARERGAVPRASEVRGMDGGAAESGAAARSIG